MILKREVLERLLLSKSFLDRIRFQPVAVHDRHTLAANIIAAHDSSEFAVAAICHQLGCLPPKNFPFLMDYLESLGDTQHPGNRVPAWSFFHDLNDVRNLLKHRGLYPDYKQWSGVGETAFQHIAQWSSNYLQTSFSDLDDSTLLADAAVKDLYDAAHRSFSAQNYKGALEQLASALSTVFEQNSALRGLEVGVAKSEDAIRLAGFGVHGNDYLALQQFLPRIRRKGKERVPEWHQSHYGHPANWTEQSVDFCLRTFVDVAVKIQGAQWIPGAYFRSSLYDQQIEAVAEKVAIWHYVEKETPPGAGALGMLALLTVPKEKQREVIKVLSRGEKLRASVSLATEPTSAMQDAFRGGPKKSADIIDVVVMGEKPIFGQMKLSEVKITCVPKDADYIRQYFPALPEFTWDPE